MDFHEKEFHQLYAERIKGTLIERLKEMVPRNLMLLKLFRPCEIRTFVPLHISRVQGIADPALWYTVHRPMENSGKHRFLRSVDEVR